MNIDGFSANEDLLTKLQAGASGYDLVTPSQHFVRIMIDQGLLEDIDAHGLDAFQAVDARWRNQWWDEGNEHSIPLANGTAGFTVNRELYSVPVDSWKVLFEPPTELQGKVAMLSYPDEIVGAAQLYLGIPFCTESSEEMKRVYDLLAAQKPFVSAYTSDNIENRIASGEVAAHFWWDGNSMKTRVNEGAPIKYAMPKEGLVGWIDSVVVPQGATNSDNAKAFVNFMSTVENATIQYNYHGHSAPVAIDASQATYTAENAPEIFPEVKIEFSRACSPAAQDLVTKVWTQLLQ